VRCVTLADASTRRGGHEPQGLHAY